MAWVKDNPYINTAEPLESQRTQNLKAGIEDVHPASATNVVASVPVSAGTESLTAQVGTAGATRTAIALYTCKKEASAKVKIKLPFKTEYPQVSAYLTSAKKATERLESGAATAGAISKVKIVSPEEIELTLVAAEPAAGKEEFAYVVTG